MVCFTEKNLTRKKDAGYHILTPFSSHSPNLEVVFLIVVVVFLVVIVVLVVVLIVVIVVLVVILVVVCAVAELKIILVVVLVVIVVSHFEIPPEILFFLTRQF